MRFKAFVSSPLNCPSCGSEFDDFAWMAWGLCGVAGSNFADYQPGDFVRWRSDADSAPRPWSRLFPQWLWNGGALGSSIVPMNLGDPSMLDVVIEDARFDHSLPFPECRSCGESFFAAVQISDGLIVGSLTCHVDDQIVADARRTSKLFDTVELSESEWRPGFEDNELSSVGRFLDTCELLPEPDWPFNETAPEGWLEGMQLHRDSVRSTLLAGSKIFPDALNRYALARRLGKDPFYLKEELLDS